MQGVVADHADRCELGSGGERAIACGGEQKVAIHDILTLEHAGLARLGEGPEFSAAAQHASRFQLEAADRRQISIELQNLGRLHHVVSGTDDGQRGLRVRAVQHLLLGKRMNGTQMTLAGDEPDLRRLY